MKLEKFKRGDTFALNADIEVADGSPLELPASHIRSQIRTRNDILVETLRVDETDTPGRYTIMAHDTTNWPIGTLEMDIEIDNGAAIISSPTIYVPVERDITRI